MCHGIGFLTQTSSYKLLLVFLYLKLTIPIKISSLKYIVDTQDKTVTIKLTI